MVSVPSSNATQESVGIQSKRGQSEAVPAPAWEAHRGVPVPVVCFADADRLLIHYGNHECRSDRPSSDPSGAMTDTERRISEVLGVREVQLCRGSQILLVDICRIEGDAYLRTSTSAGGDDGHTPHAFVKAQAQLPHQWKGKDGLLTSTVSEFQDGERAQQARADARQLKALIDALGGDLRWPA